MHALGYSYHDIDRALAELRASLGGQAPNGMIPHITFYNHTPDKKYYPGPEVWQHKSKHNVPISGISQPPLMGFALGHILSRLQKEGKSVEDYEARLLELMESTMDYHR